MYKEKINPIFNKNLPIFSLFCMLGTIYLGFIVNYWYLMLVILCAFTIRKIKPNKWQILLLVFILVIFILLIIFVSDFSLVEAFNNWFNKLTNGGPTKWFDNFFDKFYSKETTSFIKLVLFNVRSKETYIFLNQAVDLGIVWLISSGGFHLSLISRIINRVFKKKQLIGFCTNVVLLSIYTFFLGFAYGCLRVLFKNCFKVLFIRTKMDRFNQLGFVGILICLFNPSCYGSYSFLLSFLVCIGSYSIIGLSLNNKLLITLLINLVAFLITIPFVIEMNHKIAILTFINSFVFTYFFMFIFLYFLIFSWMPFMSIIHYGIIRCSYVLIGNISFTNYYIWSNQWEAWAKTTYYLVFFVLFKITYLIVINNKI